MRSHAFVTRFQYSYLKFNNNRVKSTISRFKKRVNCVEVFKNDLNAVEKIKQKFKDIKFDKIINKVTVDMIISDLEESFPIED